MAGEDVLARRIDEAADRRECRASAPLGVGYYTADVRARAKALAASMLAAAEGHGITLALLDGTCDLAATALDAASLTRERF